MEKQKNSLLSEEVKIKKGSVERLRSELENTKEQLEYIKEEKGKKIYIYCAVSSGHLLWSKVVFTRGGLALVPGHRHNLCWVQTLGTPSTEVPLSARIQG